MAAEIRLGKISSIDYAKGMARVVYHEKDDDVTRLIPLISHEYKMPPVGSRSLWSTYPTGRRPAWSWAGRGAKSTSHRRAGQPCTEKTWGKTLGTP